MNNRLEKIENDIANIQKRNRRVELEKAWETSLTRKISILIITYILVILVMYALHITQPFTNAIIPTIGYFLSTQSLPFIKRWWIKNKSDF